MVEFLYRIIFVKMSHETKMKWVEFFWKIPLFKNVLESKFDYNPDSISTTSTFSKEEYLQNVNKCPIDEDDGANELEQYFFDSEHRYVSKHWKYFEVYNRYFKRFKNKKDIVIVEVGIFKGGSLQMWKDYFDSSARIVGIDINPECKAYEEDGIEIHIGSQEDREFWREFKEKYPKVDIFIDDGGHTMNQQIVTFEEMYDCISENGIYICEDCATSYWPSMGGQYGYKGSFIEFSKKCVDYIHARYSHSKKLKVNDITETLYGIHFYDQMVVFEKNGRAGIENDTVGIGI